MAKWMPREGREQAPETTDSSDDDDNFILETDRHVFDRRLSVRQKLTRAGLALAVVSITSFFVLGGPDAARTFLQSFQSEQAIAAVAAHPLRTRVELLPPPGEAQTAPTMRISPAAGNRGDAYACWADPGPTGADGIVKAGLLHTARLGSDRASWVVLKPPMGIGTRCILVADSVREAWLVIGVYTISSAGATCVLPRLFMSRTAGDTWTRVPWPNEWVNTCGVQLSLVDGHLYATADGPLLIRNALEVGAQERIMTTGDAGVTWQVADIGLPFVSNVVLIGARPGGRLLAQTTDDSVAATGTLWESVTDGAEWESLGPLPGANAQVYVSSNPAVTSEGGWGRLYVVAQTETNGIPDGPDHPLLASGFPGGSWTGMPLPAAGTGIGGASVPVIDRALVGPGDTLALMRMAPSLDRRQFLPPHYLWVWNPARRTWKLAPFLVQSNSIFQGETWSGDHLRVWMTKVYMGLPPSVQIETFTLTPAVTG